MGGVEGSEGGNPFFSVNQQFFYASRSKELRESNNKNVVFDGNFSLLGLRSFVRKQVRGRISDLDQDIFSTLQMSCLLTLLGCLSCPAIFSGIQTFEFVKSVPFPDFALPTFSTEISASARESINIFRRNQIGIGGWT